MAYFRGYFLNAAPRVIDMTTFDSQDPDITRGEAWHQPVDHECRAALEPRAPQATP